MVEALACGTPVLALRAGSVPEVIRDGATGFVCDTEDALVAAVSRLPEIDRATCRQEVMRRFSAAAMADAYECVYERLAGTHRVIFDLGRTGGRDAAHHSTIVERDHQSSTAVGGSIRRAHAQVQAR